MEIKISGQSIDVGESASEYIKEKTSSSVKKFFDKAIDVSVVFSKSRSKHLTSCHIVVNEGVRDGITLKSEAEGQDVYSSFGVALEKIVARLRKYKERLTDYLNRRNNAQIEMATKYIISHYQAEDLAVSESEVEQGNSGPVIIEEKGLHVQNMSVADAVMKMELEGLPALVFTNSKTGQKNFIYIRNDGNISWIQ